MKIIVYSLLSTFLVVLTVLLGVYITGRTNRAYPVLMPNKKIIVSKNEITTEKLAKKYKPIMYLRETTSSPPLLWVWYEVVPNKKTYDIVYYFNWENEINPNKRINILYSIFRSAYYGYPLYDIEYFQVNVNKETANIDKIKFETSEINKYDQEVVGHIIADVKYINSDTYKEIHRKKSGEIVKEEIIKPLFEGSHVLAGVITWNHLSCLLDSNNIKEYTICVDSNITLRFLSDKDYSKFKFARKSQGDHKTKENKVPLVIALLSILLITTLPIYLRYKILNKKKANE